MSKKNVAVTVAIILIAIAGIVTTILFFPQKKSDDNTISDPDGFEAYYKAITSDEVTSENGIYYVDSQILLTAISPASFEEVQNLVSNFDGEIVGYISTTNDYQISFQQRKTYQELVDITQQLRNNSLIETATISYVAGLENGTINYSSDPWLDADNPTDTSGSIWDESNPVGNNWWAEAIHMPTVWDMDLDTETVKVGIIDSMFDTTNEDLDENTFAKTWNNPVDENGNCNVTEIYNNAVSDYNRAINNRDKDLQRASQNLMINSSHGTHVAGIIAAQAENGFGIIGVNQDVHLYGYAVLSDDASASEEAVWGSIFMFKCAIAQLLNEGVKVINISMGFNDALTGSQDGDSNWQTFVSENSAALEAFLLKYIEAGNEFLICKSAGNDSTSNNRYDAANDVFGAISNSTVSDRIIIVGAAQYNTDGYYCVADFSNTGSRVVVYAPGVDILSDIPSNVTALKSGTSMSTPIVTGLASLIWGINPELSAEQVRSIIYASTSSTIFDLDSRPGIVRDWINFWSDPTAIVDARLCVQLAQSSVGTAGVPTKAMGTITGMIYSVSSNGEELYETNITDIVIYDESGIRVMSLEPESIALPINDSTTGELRMLKLQSYSAVLEAGIYTIEVNAEGFESQSQEIVIEENEMNIYDFEFVDYSNLVTDAYAAEITGEYGDCLFSIPQINIAGGAIEAINKEIWDKLYVGVVEEIRANLSYAGGEYIKYEWVINGDILSLWIESHPVGWAWWDYYVYNVAISTGTPLSNEEVISSAGLTTEEYYEKAKQVLGSQYWSNWERDNDNFYDPNFVEWFNQSLRNTISDENIRISTPCFNSDGQLCIVAPVYSMAGADYYWHILNMEDFVLLPYYAEDAVLLTHSINISEDKAYEIACDYWNYSPGSVSEETGFELFLVYDGLKEKYDGNHYYSFRLQWWVPEEAGWGNHMSTIDYLYVNAETGECTDTI